MLKNQPMQNLGFTNKGKSVQVTEVTPTDWKDVLEKAEKHFARGEYEQALLLYHRGKRLRPKAKEFPLGVAKCEQAIANNTETQEDVNESNLNHSQFDLASEKTYGKMTEKSRHTQRTRGTNRSTHMSHASSTKTTERVRDVEHIVGLDKDRLYLKGLLKQLGDEKLTARPTTKGSTKTKVRSRRGSKGSMLSVVEESLQFIDTRSVYWRQQMPVHTLRDLHTHLQSRLMTAPAQEEDSEFNRNYAHLLSEIMRCNEEFMHDQYENCAQRADKCIRMLKKYKSSEINNKYEILGSLYSVKGNALFETEQYPEALECYNKDLEIANDKDLLASKSRALENMGRVHARVGEFDTAIKTWEERLQMHGQHNEEAWLFHEIGYCHLSKQEYIEAREYGVSALALAEKSRDRRWQLNSWLLIAQAQAKLRDYEKARSSFQEAFDFAHDIGDKDLQRTIKEAIHDSEIAIKYTKQEEEKQRAEAKLQESQLKVDHSILEKPQKSEADQDNENSSKEVKFASESQEIFFETNLANKNTENQSAETEMAPVEMPAPKSEKKPQTKHLDYEAPERTGKYKDMNLKKFREELKKEMEQKHQEKEAENQLPKKPQKPSNQKPSQPSTEAEKPVRPPPTQPAPHRQPSRKSQRTPSVPNLRKNMTPAVNTKQETQIDEDLSATLQEFDEAVNKDKHKKDTNNDNSNKKEPKKLPPWKSRYKEKPARELTIYFKTGTHKQVREAPGAVDDDDDEEYNDLFDAKNHRVMQSQKSHPVI